MFYSHYRGFKKSLEKVVSEGSDWVDRLARGEPGDAQNIYNKTVDDWNSLMSDILISNRLTTQEKFLLAHQKFYLSYATMFDEDTPYLNIEYAGHGYLLARYLDVVIDAGRHAPGTVCRTLRNRVFLENIFKNEILVFKLMDALKRLPVRFSVSILTHETRVKGDNTSLLKRLFEYRASNTEKFKKKSIELKESLLLKLDSPSDRYKILMMNIREIPSAPPLLPVAQIAALDSHAPLAEAILEAIEVQRDFFHYQREEIPVYLLDHIHETIEDYRYVKFTSIWHVVENLTIIFLWIFCRQDNLNKATFLDNLLTHISNYPEKLYSDCIEDTVEARSDRYGSCRLEGKIDRILQALEALDMPVARVQNEVSDAEAKVYNMPELDQGENKTYGTRPLLL